jgi:hypothetical protein
MQRKALRHLHVELVDALQVALTGRAPPALIEELAAASGMTEALVGLPSQVMEAAVLQRAKRSLASWTAWQRGAGRMVAAA